MEKEKLNLVEEFHKNGFIYMMLGTLISSDSLSSIEDCEFSLERLEKLNEDLKTADIEEEMKKEYQDFIDRGFEIIKRDMEQFKMETK